MSPVAHTMCPKGHLVTFSSPENPTGAPRFWSCLRLPGDPVLAVEPGPRTDQQSDDLKGFGYVCQPCCRMYWCDESGASMLPTAIQIISAIAAGRAILPNLIHGYVILLDAAIAASCCALLDERFNRFRVEKKLEG